MPLVDVAINVYGKPYQTAVTLFSLLKHSGKHIDKIYFIEEKNQLHSDSVDFIIPWFADKIIYYKPPIYLGYTPQVLNFNNFRERISVRYQYAWEASDKDCLFITHNDCLYTGDIIGGMLERINKPSVAGVGLIGQCWNCPANSAKLCNGNNYNQFKPSYEQALQIVDQFESPRTKPSMIDPASPMPFPECRLNEFACLVSLARTRQYVYPCRDVVPFGTMGLDTGTDWFRGMALKGLHFINYFEHVSHGWIVNSGHWLVLDKTKDRYNMAEQTAKDYLEANFSY